METSPALGHSLRASAVLRVAIGFDKLALPEALEVSELQNMPRVEAGPLRLSWSGSGREPLSLRLHVSAIPDGLSSIEVACLLADDGEYVLSEDLLSRLPQGFVRAEFRRESRAIAASNGKKIVTIGAIDVSHRFVLGSACDGADAVAACSGYADAVERAYSECGISEPPQREVLCPDYLAEACAACPEYYECMAHMTRCDQDGLHMGFGCACP